MTGTTCIRIPTAIDSPIEAVPAFDFSDRSPAYVAELDFGNPDDFGLAFYMDLGNPPNLDSNERATLVARAAANVPREADSPTIVGDVFVVCEDSLATVILDNDKTFQEDAKVIRAFREWMDSYAAVNGVDTANVFVSVSHYVDHIQNEAREAATKDHVSHVAALLGIDPSQIGVVIL